MKKGLLLAAVMFCSAVSAFSAVTIRYQNTDAKNHQFEVRIDGASKSVTFEASKTSSVTIAGTMTACRIKTPGGLIEVKDGSNILIKDGRITFVTSK